MVEDNQFQNKEKNGREKTGWEEEEKGKRKEALTVTSRRPLPYLACCGAGVQR